MDNTINPNPFTFKRTFSPAKPLILPLWAYGSCISVYEALYSLEQSKLSTPSIHKMKPLVCNRSCFVYCKQKMNLKEDMI